MQNRPHPIRGQADVSYTPVYTIGPNKSDVAKLQFSPIFAIVDNPTNFWVTFPQVSRQVEPGRLRVILRIARDNPYIEYRTDTVPTGYPTPQTPVGTATIIFTDDALAESAGSAAPGIQVSRGYYYDRNPLKVIQRYYSGNIAPHAPTSRWTYTCPANRKAYVDNLFVKVLRNTAATTAGLVEATAFFTSAASVQGSLARASEISNTVGVARDVVTGLAGLMLPGDKLEGITNDASTAGTYQFEISANITEFDA